MLAKTQIIMEEYLNNIVLMMECLLLSKYYKINTNTIIKIFNVMPI